MKRLTRHAPLGMLGLALQVLTVVLLSACSTDDTAMTGRDAAEIRFNINTRRVAEGTRATTISSDAELQSRDLNIDAYFDGTDDACLVGAKLRYNISISEWNFVDGSGDPIKHFWPIVGSVETSSGTNVTGVLDFVGYTPYNLSNTGVSNIDYSSATFSFDATLPMTSTTPGVGETTQQNLQEFLIAYTPDQNSSPVNMSFCHPFARIKFQVSASHPFVRINTITLKGLKSGGHCSFDGSTVTWPSLTPADETIDFVATINQDCPTSASAQAVGTDYLVVPQTFGGEISVNAGWIDWGEVIPHTVSTTLPSPVVWQAGYSYTYTFTITETDLIVNTEKFTEQW